MCNCVLCQTAERIVTGQTVQRPASVTTGRSATDATAAVPACTAGSDSLVKKVQWWQTDTHASLLCEQLSQFIITSRWTAGDRLCRLESDQKWHFSWLCEIRENNVKVLTAFASCRDCTFSLVSSLFWSNMCVCARWGGLTALCVFPQVDLRASPMAAAAAEETRSARTRYSTAI